MAAKSDLIEKLKNKLPYLSEEDAAFSVNIVLDYIKEELSKGNRVEIRGFGSLSVRGRKYAGRDASYNTVYYRMAKNIEDSLK
jgi:nucleoid DNA-binding protein